MCYAASCNPRCGKCRPKRIVEAACPRCGAVCAMGREEYLQLFELPHKRNVIDEKILERGGVKPPTCGVCGSSMTEAFRAAVEPLECARSRILCGFPCGGRFEKHREGARPCQHMVPLGRLREEASSRRRSG